MYEMTNEENIKSYTVEEIRAMRARGESRTNWAEIEAMTEEEIEAAIASDPEEAGIEWDWDSAKLVIPEPKEHINLRVDADVLRFFKSQGKGYQTRINAVLRSYMMAQQEKHPQP
jgi:uncharacterized protein (DUF4415 family)